MTKYLDNYDANKMTIASGGKSSAINVGTYQFAVTPKSGYCWPDGTKTNKPVEWEIKRAPCSIRTAEDEIILNVCQQKIIKVTLPEESTGLMIFRPNADIIAAWDSNNKAIDFKATRHITGDVKAYCTATTNYDMTEKIFHIRTEPRTIVPLTGTTMSTYYSGGTFTELPDIVDTSLCTHLNNFFISCTNLKKIDMSSFDVSNVKSLTGTFSNCSNLEEIIMPCTFSKEFLVTLYSTFTNCSSLKEICLPEMQVDYLQATFYNCTSLKSIDFTNIINKEDIKIKSASYDYGNVVQIGLFQKCETLEAIPLASYNFDNNSASYTFAECKSLKSIPFENFNTENIVCFAYLCFNCESLESVNFDSLNTKNGTDFRSMFQNCTNLKNVTGTLDLTALPQTFSYKNKNGQQTAVSWGNLVLSAFSGTQVKSLKIKAPEYLERANIDTLKTNLGLSSDAEIIFV